VLAHPLPSLCFSCRGAMFRSIAIVLTATVLVDACDVFKHGRVSVGVDGLTDKCCGSMSSVTDSILKAAAAGDDNFEAQQEAQNKLVTTLITDCCSSDDQGVLATLAPEEPPEASAQITQMCAMGGPPSAVALATGSKTLELLRINHAMRTSLKQEFLAQPVELFAVGDNSKNNYLPGKNGPVFDTPAPSDNRTQSYMDTAKYASIFGFFFLGVVMLICWMECKTFCKTVTVFGH